MEKIDEKHRNVDILNEMLGLPSNAVYIILNESKKIAYVSIPRNPIAWFSRQAQDLKNGVHICGPIMEWQFIKRLVKLSSHFLKQCHSDICKEYVKQGYKLVGSSKPSVYKVRYAIKQNKVFLQLVNSRNRVIGKMNFDTVPMAKAFAKGKTIIQLLEAIRDDA